MVGQVTSVKLHPTLVNIPRKKIATNAEPVAQIQMILPRRCANATNVGAAKAVRLSPILVNVLYQWIVECMQLSHKEGC